VLARWTDLPVDKRVLDMHNSNALRHYLCWKLGGGVKNEVAMVMSYVVYNNFE